ncbi:hypothetical protein DL766_001957 [Monosporascus sp. MC13-8B]|uniref:Mid2 domain-containing protein n=1 Tax=Monosporascus cannonballus TaxID=155416 RepID=A0ABY0HB05_9PEZI|nr:hypothetical protein DL762_004858 [Monosporascus cannonballus]RYO99595.1 hypothetical protein DL763_001414 [Monosporascus cannonballus]RYP36455.1 hypothetical protein DL766_001957 [Monosporascus sp. MC13-8B]
MMYRASWNRAAGSVLLSSLLLFIQVAADVSFEGDLPRELEMGTSYNVRWSTDAPNVKVTVVSGSEASNNIYHLFDIICDVWVVNDLTQACTTTYNGVDWTPPGDLPVGHYMLMASAADGSTAFSRQFNLVKAGDGSKGSSQPPSSPSASVTTSSFVTTSGGSTQSTTSTTTGTPAPSEPSSQTDEPSSSSTGLGAGAKAGIGIGAAVGGLALLAALGFLLFRMGKRAAGTKKKEDKTKEEGEEGSKAEAPVSKEAEPVTDFQQTNDTGISELQAPNTIHEAPDYKHLDTPGQRVFAGELDATGGSFVIPPPAHFPTAAPAVSGITDTAAEATEDVDEAGAAEAGDGPATTPDPHSPVVYETPDDIGRRNDK